MQKRDIPILAEENNEEMQEIANLENSALLAIIASYQPVQITPSKTTSAQISFDEEFEIRKAINVIKSRSDCNKLFLLINSPGGWVQSSYMIAHALQESFNEIFVFIPHIAASGATLISLIGSKIIMDGLMSRLSPLDPQFDYMGATTSVNTIIRSFTGVTSFFEDTHETDAPYPWKVLAEKSDPILLQECFDTVDLMSMYAMDVLAHKNNIHVKYGDKNTPADEDLEKVRRMVMQFLSLEYPLHEYVILQEEAREIGLETYDYSKDKDLLDKDFKFETEIIWERMVDWFDKYKNEPSAYHFIRYVVPQGENGGEKIDMSGDCNA